MQGQASDRIHHGSRGQGLAGEAGLRLGGRDHGRLWGVVVLCVDPLHEAAEGGNVDVGPIDAALSLLRHVGEEVFEMGGDWDEDGAVDGEQFLVGAAHEGEDSGSQDAGNSQDQHVSLEVGKAIVLMMSEVLTQPRWADPLRLREVDNGVV